MGGSLGDCTGQMGHGCEGTGQCTNADCPCIRQDTICMGDTLRGPCDSTGQCCNGSCQTCCDQPVYLGGWGDPFYYPGPVWIDAPGGRYQAPMYYGGGSTVGYVPPRATDSASADLLRQLGGGSAGSGEQLWTCGNPICGSDRNSVIHNSRFCDDCGQRRPAIQVIPQPSAPPARSSSDAELRAPGPRKQAGEPSCSICMEDDMPREAVFLPCRHLAACRSCALRIKSLGQGCPICRTHIEHAALLPKYKEQHPTSQVFRS